MGGNQGDLDNPFVHAQFDQEKPELGDVEPSLPYSYFVARNPRIGDKTLVDFVVDEYILDWYGQQEHRETVDMPDGELSWEDALRAHMARIEALFRTLDTVITQDTRLVPADWCVINHMLYGKLRERMRELNTESGRSTFISDDTSRMTEWLYIHYLLGALRPERKEEIYKKMLSADPNQLFEEYESFIKQAGKKSFPTVPVRPPTFFYELDKVITAEERDGMKERLKQLDYRKTFIALNSVMSKDPTALPQGTYTILPELKMYHVSEEEINTKGIAHMMNQSINKQGMLSF